MAFKFELSMMLPSGDTFIVQKELPCQAWQYQTWKHGFWTNPFKVGDRIMNDGIGDNGLYAFKIIDKESCLPGKTCYGLKKSDLEALINDETLLYNAQYCYPNVK